MTVIRRDVRPPEHFNVEVPDWFAELNDDEVHAFEERQTCDAQVDLLQLGLLALALDILRPYWPPGGTVAHAVQLADDTALYAAAVLLSQVRWEEVRVG